MLPVITYIEICPYVITKYVNNNLKNRIFWGTILQCIHIIKYWKLNSNETHN